MQIIIGICGYKQSGKDTACEFIRQQLCPPFFFKRIAFADALKDEVCALFKCSREDIEKDKEKYRHILQDYGQRAKETRGEGVWVSEVDKKIKELQKNSDKLNQVIIIPDCRFPFEGLFIKEGLEGFLIKIERYEDTIDQHPSETSVTKVKNIDYFLPNKGTLRDLERECKWAAQLIRQRYKI